MEHIRMNLQLFAADPMEQPFGKPTEGDDDTFEADLSDADTTSPFGRIPKGDYVGKLVDLKKETSSNGNPMWTWTFVITHGPHSGREFKLWTVRTPAGAWKVAETLEALQLGKAGEKPKFTRKDALNRRCIMEVVDDTYQGNESSKLQKIKPHPDGPFGASKQAADGPDPAAAAGSDGFNPDDVPF